MWLDPNVLESSSVHYFIPAPEKRRSILYYPISTGYFDCKPTYHIERTNFNSYLLLLMLSGSLSFQTRHSHGIARPGQALLIDCNAPHQYAAQGKCAFCFVHFDGSQSAEIYDEIVQQCGNLVRLQNSVRLQEAIGELMDVMRNDRRVKESQSSLMLYSILMELLESSGVGGAGMVGNKVVDYAIEYIQSHLTEKLTVETIAANAGYSASYFSQLFQQETGMSPYQFVVKNRVERAQQLLQTTRLSVQDIAFQTGFNSVANFCYAFKRITGITPHEHRRRGL